ncbi:MAG: hypothetical protein QM581_07905 [Pseudomonas sp.]
MLSTSIVLASVLAGLGAWLFYLACPQQQWRAAGPWPMRRRWLPGSAALALALALLLGRTGTLEAWAICACAAMLAGSLAPFLGAWRARQREKRA